MKNDNECKQNIGMKAKKDIQDLKIKNLIFLNLQIKSFRRYLSNTKSFIQLDY